PSQRASNPARTSASSSWTPAPTSATAMRTCTKRAYPIGTRSGYGARVARWSRQHLDDVDADPIDRRARRADDAGEREKAVDERVVAVMPHRDAGRGEPLRPPVALVDERVVTRGHHERGRRAGEVVPE